MKRDLFLRNCRTHFLLQEFSSMRYGGPSSRWEGDLAAGEMRWRGDDGAEFAVVWDESQVLAGAQILECERGPDGDCDWDEDEDPQGEARGWQYLETPPATMRPLYMRLIRGFTHELLTAGLWISEGASFNPADATDLACGGEYFADFMLAPEAFPFGLPGQMSWAALASLDSQDLRPLVDLAVALSGKAFQGGYKLSADERATLETSVPDGAAVDAMLDELAVSFAKLQLAL